MSMSRLVLLSSTLARLSSEGMAPHIKFFGYFASAMAGAGSGDYINEVSDHSNMAWIAGNMSNKVSKLPEWNEVDNQYAMGTV